MMNKPFGLALVIAGIIVVLISPCLAQEDMQVVDNSAFARVHRSPALFAHDVHNEAAGIDDCGVCHHVYENGVRSEVETSEDKACVECHSVSAAGNKIPLRRAFHLRCKGCHLAQDAGPILCGECHRVE
jgi:hypothetical protein